MWNQHLNTIQVKSEKISRIQQDTRQSFATFTVLVVPVTASITNMFHYEAFKVPRINMLHMARSPIWKLHTHGHDMA